MQNTQPTIDRFMRNYSHFINDVLGVLAFETAFSCISTEAPKLYGFISLIFITFVWMQGVKPYQRILKLLNEVEHPSVTIKAAIKMFAIFLLGWLFLACVAVGFLNNNGFVR